ncbi:MAG: hypothetical protein NC299_04380 [Lachnospiraceae bacterium]|nr:hypothetical protein [Ruminococcus sp.]MCM1274585.1 hypothetical protein [Lachnospiraceae bacterium]
MKSAGDRERFSAALGAALMNDGRGFHGSVGTQNEKLIHAVLKNYYAPYSDEQEIRIGSFFADAVSEDGIFEIQTKALYRLKDKLRVFSEHSRVTVVHPVIGEYRTLFVCEDSGEIADESAPRRQYSKLKIFEELYSIREFLNEENLSIILVRLKTEKRVYFRGEKIPDMRNRAARKRCLIKQVPLEITEELRLDMPRDYAVFLPEGLPERFTKKQLCAAAKESRSSLRTEVLRTVGLIRRVGEVGREFLYEVNEKERTIW